MNKIASKDNNKYEIKLKGSYQLNTATKLLFD